MVEYVGLPPAKIGAAEVRRFLLYLIKEVCPSPRTVNVYLAGIRFLYLVTLKRPEVVADVGYMKTAMHLPRFLSGPEVERLLAALPTVRWQAVAMLAFGAGLRVGEIARLEIGDIDAKRMVIHIRGAKRDVLVRTLVPATEPLLARTRTRRPWHGQSASVSGSSSRT